MGMTYPLVCEAYRATPKGEDDRMIHERLAAQDLGSLGISSADDLRRRVMLDGEDQGEISLDEARALAAQIGLPVP